MKKLIIAAVGASMLAAPALAAPYDHGRYDNGRGYQKSWTAGVTKARKAQNHKWRKGERFDSRYARSYREIRNPRAYRLNDAPRGYRWVQSDNDAVLVGIATGVVAAILANAF